MTEWQWVYLPCSLAKIWFTSRLSRWRFVDLKIHVSFWKLTHAFVQIQLWFLLWILGENSGNFYISGTLQGWLQGGGPSACSVRRAADPPTATTAKASPVKPARAGRRLGKSKHHCSWTFVCLCQTSCIYFTQAIINHWILLWTVFRCVHHDGRRRVLYHMYCTVISCVGCTMS